MLKVNDFYKHLFGSKTYKISLNAGCTCPNRDGKVGDGGCIFCSKTGSGDFSPNSDDDIAVQIEKSKALVSKKLKNQQNVKYIAYFQNFTNTYGDLACLEKLWRKAISFENVVGLSIATRPDCLSEECLKIFSKLGEETFLQVELGFQTSNEKTAEYIRRGFKNEVYFDAVKSLKNANQKIHVVTHVIFGLPDENQCDMIDTVKKVVEAGSDGIKITCLYVLRNTDLLLDYEKGLFKTLSMNEYFNLVQEALKILPKNMVVHRITGDPPKKDLVEPKWTENKKLVLCRVNQIFDEFVQQN